MFFWLKSDSRSFTNEVRGKWHCDLRGMLFHSRQCQITMRNSRNDSYRSIGERVM